MKKILCIHAHESNIYYLDRLLGTFDCAIDHQMIRLADNPKNSAEMLKKEITSYFCDDVIACFLTCTVHGSLVDEEMINGVPIFKIEDPIIEKLSQDPCDKVLLFTNPSTVNLTVNKIKHSRGRFQNYDVEIIPDSFELILNNEQALYKAAIVEYIRTKTKDVYLMQLSMSIIQEESLLNDVRISTVYKEAEGTYTKIISELLKKEHADESGGLHAR